MHNIVLFFCYLNSHSESHRHCDYEMATKWHKCCVYLYTTTSSSMIETQYKLNTKTNRSWNCPRPTKILLRYYTIHGKQKLFVRVYLFIFCSCFWWDESWAYICTPIHIHHIRTIWWWPVFRVNTNKRNENK